jgi:hypothetical protein
VVQKGEEVVGLVWSLFKTQLYFDSVTKFITDCEHSCQISALKAIDTVTMIQMYRGATH